MGTPLGDFLRAKRDSTRPETLGLPIRPRRRAPGLNRADLAARAGISVEYLTRIEQGRDRRPSVAVVNALADALDLAQPERDHLWYLAKLTGGECREGVRAAPVRRDVRTPVRRTLRLLEPGVAVVTNRLGDILAHTTGFAAMVRGTGLLDAPEPNLSRYVFTDQRARTFFTDWAEVADQQAFDLWFGPPDEDSARLGAELATRAGAAFTDRVEQHVIPRPGVLRLHHPEGARLRLLREPLELAADAQQLHVLLPADDATAAAIDRIRGRDHGGLRVIS